RLALRLGLAGKALGVLEFSSPDLYGKTHEDRLEGIRLLLELLLMTGRTQDARVLLDRDEMRRNPDGLGTYDLLGNRPGGQRFGYRFVAYDWFDLCQSAASGDYERATRSLTRLRGRMRLQGEQLSGPLTRATLGHMVTELGLGAAPEIGFLRM